MRRREDIAEDIAETLCVRAQTLSLAQVAGAWFGDRSRPRRRAAELLGDRPERFRLLRISTLAPPPLERPEILWRPGEAAPDFQRVAWRLRWRWAGMETRRMRIIAPTRALCRLYGVGFPKLAPGQIAHDLCMGELYLRARREEPERALRWRGESVFARELSGGKRPDAVLLRADGRVERVIDFGGQYPAARLRALHAFCHERNLAYELW